ncbi:alpha/beta hydrolase [soil metagenome]
MRWRHALAGAGIALTAVAGTTGTGTATTSRVEPIEFTVDGERMVGDLFLADGVSPETPGPAVVVTGAWMTVRQQMATTYARQLATRGYSALVFDYRGWGESEGARRQFEDPAAKVIDTRAAIDYLVNRPDTDDARIGVVGICASSGYIVEAASHPAVQSVALAAPWLHDRDLVLQTYGGPAGVDTLLRNGAAAEEEFGRTGDQQFVPAASLTDEQAIMFGAPYYTEPARGMIPAWRNEADPAFWRGWLDFDGVAKAGHLRRPLLMVHSESAAIPDGARRFYSAVASPKSELWLDGVTQFDFYDQPAAVATAADAIAVHFQQTLS